MTKARNIADLLDANGDVKTDSLDNVPASNDASALTTGTLNNARLPNDISDGGTEGTKIASGTTAQRGSTTGQLRFNTTIGLAEYYDGTAFKGIDAPPVVSSVDVTEVDSTAGSTETIVITGSNFSLNPTVLLVGNAGTDITPASVTRNSATQITITATRSNFLNAQEPYGVKVTNVSGLSATLASQINVDSSPTWSTSSGLLATATENTSVNTSATASDAEGDTIVYSETTSVLSGIGLSLNTSTGAITGTAGSVSSDTTFNFTLRATAGGKTADRAFSITINKLAYDISYLILAGGGGGGLGVNAAHSEGGGGGGAGQIQVSNYSNVGGGTVLNITVGDGGNGATNANANGASGANSVLSASGFSTITSLGGGYGGGTNQNGGNGGAGGGGGSGTSGGSGGQCTVGIGGDGGGGTGGGEAGGGGGSAGNGGSGSSGTGGSGFTSSFTGSSITYGGGGGGGSPTKNPPKQGGSGGGGNGAIGFNNVNATNGTDGLGAGGGGGGINSSSRGGDGGSGVVILKVPSALYSGTTTGSPTVSVSGSDRIIKFTSNGTYTA